MRRSGEGVPVLTLSHLATARRDESRPRAEVGVCREGAVLDGDSKLGLGGAGCSTRHRGSIKLPALR